VHRTLQVLIQYASEVRNGMPVLGALHYMPPHQGFGSRSEGSLAPVESSRCCRHCGHRHWLGIPADAPACRESGGNAMHQHGSSPPSATLQWKDVLHMEQALMVLRFANARALGRILASISFRIFRRVPKV
jgi:hypothetical protein